MAIDPACRIAVVNSCRYRAESLAFAIAQQSGYEALGVTESDLALLVHCSTIVIEVDQGLEPALKLTLAITTQQPRAKVILLGLVESQESVLKMAEVGASGYVSPAASFEEVVSVVNAVQKGEFTCPPEITYALFSHLAELTRSNVSTVFQNAALTIRERRVMELMSRRLSNKEIAEHLCISQLTVKNHVHHILKKTGARSRIVACRPTFTADP